MTFLHAAWEKLAIANYWVDSSILRPFVPLGTELDLWQGKCYVSLVGFMFLNTRLMGVKVPFHVDFEEVNMRFYVKRFDGAQWKRGVVFIKEFVPKPALAWVANTIYGEHYAVAKMRHQWNLAADSLEVSYGWKWQGKWQTIFLNASPVAVQMEQGSEVEFITEHYWGYVRINDHLSYEYEVTHPKWAHYPVKEFSIQVDFGKVYGPAFAALSDHRPVSVMLAEGSDITVEQSRKIEK